MDVELYFKPAGDDVRLLIIHSTEDDIGSKTAESLRAKLADGVEVVGVERAADFSSVVKIVEKASPFNVLLVIAHGDKRDHKLWLHADKDGAGNELGVNAGELKAALGDKVGDKLVIFGVCYAGTKDLATLMLDHAGALACVAPKPNRPVSNRQIIEGYGKLLNDIQAAKTVNIGPYELKKFVRDPDFQTIFSTLSVVPEV